jgi:4-diphosphocytidyl-2-C-methyl-D-erythritol kinase
VTARVPAKVNLQLSVGPPGADGYHDLVTVFHALALFDEVTVTSASTDSVVVTGEGARSVPLGPDNLAARAVAALVDAVGPGVRDSPGLAIEITKRIPVAAGLAGGSADAAGALVACNELWGTGLSHQELSEVAARVGSDVGFALLGGTAVGLGRGDRVTPALAAGTYHWVLAFADGQLSTPAVYAACDRLRARAAGPGPAGKGPSGGRAASGAKAASGGQPASGSAAAASGARAASGGRAASGSRTTSGGRAAAGGKPASGGRPDSVGPPQLDTALMAALRSGDPAVLGPLLSNDLQPAAVSLLPRLRQTLAAGREYGALGGIVSGSGPTCAFLARDGAHARDLAVALAGAGVCRTVASVTGPASGAAVISVPADGRPGGLPGGSEAGRPAGRP